MYVGVFGSIFLLAQFFQTTQGCTPLQADELGQGLRWAARKARRAGCHVQAQNVVRVRQDP